MKNYYSERSASDPETDRRLRWAAANWKRWLHPKVTSSRDDCSLLYRSALVLFEIHLIVDVQGQCGQAAIWLSVSVRIQGVRCCSLVHTRSGLGILSKSGWFIPPPSTEGATSCRCAVIPNLLAPCWAPLSIFVCLLKGKIDNTKPQSHKNVSKKGSSLFNQTFKWQYLHKHELRKKGYKISINAITVFKYTFVFQPLVFLYVEQPQQSTSSYRPL